MGERGDNDEGAVGVMSSLISESTESALEIEQSFEGSEPQQIAERVIAIGDSNEDGVEDFLMTGYEVEILKKTGLGFSGTESDGFQTDDSPP